jgi:hypothetical protein
MDQTNWIENLEQIYDKEQLLCFVKNLEKDIQSTDYFNNFFVNFDSHFKYMKKIKIARNLIKKKSKKELNSDKKLIYEPCDLIKILNFIFPLDIGKLICDFAYEAKFFKFPIFRIKKKDNNYNYIYNNIIINISNEIRIGDLNTKKLYFETGGKIKVNKILVNVQNNLIIMYNLYDKIYKNILVFDYKNYKILNKITDIQLHSSGVIDSEINNNFLYILRENDNLYYLSKYIMNDTGATLESDHYLKGIHDAYRLIIDNNKLHILYVDGVAFYTYDLDNFSNLNKISIYLKNYSLEDLKFTYKKATYFFDSIRIKNNIVEAIHKIHINNSGEQCLKLIFDIANKCKIIDKIIFDDNIKFYCYVNNNNDDDIYYYDNSILKFLKIVV